MNKKQREVTGVIGMTGQGKSVWTRRYMKAFPRLFMFDPLGDADVEYISTENLLDKYENGALANGKSFKFGTLSSDDIPFFTSLSFIVGNNLFCVEECAIAFENTRGNLDSWWRELIFLGRHQSVSLLFVAQRSVSIPIAVRSQFNRFVSFRQHESADVAWLSNYFGDKLEEIPSLEPLECLDSYNGEIHRYSIPYDFPKQKELPEVGTKVDKFDIEDSHLLLGSFDDSD